MSSIFSILIVVFLGAPVWAETHQSIQCDTGEYLLTTYQSPTAQDEAVLLVQEAEGLGIYSNIFGVHHEAEPLPVWLLTEVQNSQNVLNIVATDDQDGAIADVSIDMGDRGVVRAFGIPCDLNHFNVD